MAMKHPPFPLAELKAGWVRHFAAVQRYQPEIVGGSAGLEPQLFSKTVDCAVGRFHVR